PDSGVDCLAEGACAEAVEERDGLDSELEIDLAVLAESERVIDIGNRGFKAVEVADYLNVPAFELAEVAVVLEEADHAPELADGHVEVAVDVAELVTLRIESADYVEREVPVASESDVVGDGHNFTGIRIERD